MPPIAPADLSAEQRELDETARRIMAGRRVPFTAQDENGALIGPFPAMLHHPHQAKPLLDWFTANSGTLPPKAREVAILTTGSRYGAAYELYSHSRIAAAIGIPATVITALVAGQRPALEPEEEVAHDMAAALYAGSPVPGALYRAAVGCFGEAGTAELVFLIAQYASICVVLNAYDVPLPADAE